ncbi:hypothetical protein PHYSODRAFT_458737, partial [Phytophthora sojae]
MSGRRLSYTDTQLNTAVAQVLEAASISQVSKTSGVRYRTLESSVAAAKRGEFRVSKRRSPTPLLPAEAE